MFPVSIKGVLLTSEHEVLLALNCRDEWELPGGRIEVGEQPHETVEREFLEEANIRVQAQRLIDSYLFEVIPGKHIFIATYGCVSNGPFAPEVSHEHRKLALFAAVTQQHFPDAVCGEVLADRLFLASAEFDSGRIEESEVFHGVFLCLKEVSCSTGCIFRHQSLLSIYKSARFIA